MHLIKRLLLIIFHCTYRPLGMGLVATSNPTAPSENPHLTLGHAHSTHSHKKVHSQGVYLPTINEKLLCKKTQKYK